MRTTLIFFAVSLGLASCVSGGSTRHARLMMRQASTDACVSTCNTFLQQNCTTSECLCTSANQASLQACLNCLGSNAALQSEAANLDNAAAAFNAQCQGTAAVSAAVSLPSGDDVSGDNQTSAPPSEPTISASAAGPTDAPGQGGAGVSITGAAFTLPGSAVGISPSSTPSAAATQASGKSPSGAVLPVKNGRIILLASLSLVLPVLIF
ncbi:hypothetical protein D9613_009491 [Agrocybe pediades]|uniref:Extracellular membrane protein CFEM domain-containing protein n=1 Tax=Agrocybe pediades TaxID=84607 RepID=A0A8H4VWA4_9AGAR|nr:hypothetical protein D9613_009491 [Agrocybe pediades]